MRIVAAARYTEVHTDPMPQAYLFSLVVQAAGTVLLFVVFLLLYRKFRRPAFLDWIASWGFFLASLVLLGDRAGVDGAAKSDWASSG